MTEPLEIELKLEFDAAHRARIDGVEALAGSAGERGRLVSTYFDTAGNDLQRAGYSLRIRERDGQRLQTVKADSGPAAGLYIRPEWEREIEGTTPMLDTASSPLPLVVDAGTLAQVAPLFETRVDRTVHLVTVDGARIEIAIDEGAIHAGDRQEPLCEIELELKNGMPGALFDFARMLDEVTPLRLGVRAKSERGYRLAADAGDDAVKAEAIDLTSAADAREAFAAIAQACIRQFRLNEDLMMRTGGAEALHQARVGLRRLRSAFTLFRALFEGDERAALLRRDVKWLAGELGALRNLDVLIPRVEDEHRSRLIAAREKAMEHVQAVLASARTRWLMLDLAEWLVDGDWRLAPADPALAGRDATVFAHDVLNRHRKRLRHRGKRLASLDDADRHKVRIEAKIVRYAAEFFASLFPAKKAQRRHRAFLHAIEALQDHLGELNDLADTPAMLARLGIETAPPTLDRKAHRRMRDRAEEALDTLVDLKRFWR